MRLLVLVLASFPLTFSLGAPSSLAASTPFTPSVEVTATPNPSRTGEGVVFAYHAHGLVSPVCDDSRGWVIQRGGDLTLAKTAGVDFDASFVETITCVGGGNRQGDGSVAVTYIYVPPSPQPPPPPPSPPPDDCDPNVYPECGWLLGEGEDDTGEGCTVPNGSPLNNICGQSIGQASQRACSYFFPNECSCPPGSAGGAWLVFPMKYRAGIWPMRYDVFHYWQGVLYCNAFSGGAHFTKIRRARGHHMDNVSPWGFLEHSGSSCLSENCNEQFEDPYSHAPRSQVTITTTGRFRGCVLPHSVCRERQPEIEITVYASLGVPPIYRWWWS